MDKGKQKIIANRILNFIQQFDIENRNNRLSPCMLEGLRGTLERLVINILSEIETKDKDAE